jgi:hypothetical protein
MIVHDCGQDTGAAARTAASDQSPADASDAAPLRSTANSDTSQLLIGFVEVRDRIGGVLAVRR